jgi:hypothetical protein
MDLRAMRRLSGLLVLGAFTFVTLAPIVAMACKSSGDHGCCCKAPRENVVCAPDCCDVAKPVPANQTPTRFSAQQALVFAAREICRADVVCAEPLTTIRSQHPIYNGHGPPLRLRI